MTDSQGDGVEPPLSLSRRSLAYGEIIRARSASMSARAGRLEEFDWVTRRVIEHDLLAAWPADDVAAERHAGRAQAFDIRVNVIDDEMEAVPSSRGRLAPIGRQNWQGR